jgi:ribosomal protein L29
MTEFNGKTKEELMKLLTEKRHGLHAFRFSLAGGKAKNVKEGRTLRKDIARILTAMKSASVK